MTVYGNAFSTDPGTCFRWVYEPSTSRPTRCPDPIVTRGWWKDAAGYWWAVDACPEHATHLGPLRPGPGARFGHQKPPFPTKRKAPDGGPKALHLETSAA